MQLVDDIVLDQIPWRAGTAAPRDIVGTCKQHPAHLTYAARNKPQLGERTNPNCNVETLFDQVKITIGQHEFSPDARMRIEKTPYERSNVPAAEQGRCSHSQDTV